jgi:hypothetical protein
MHSADAVNWIKVPVRKSNCGQKRFWYSVPLVIDSKASTQQADFRVHDQPHAAQAEQQAQPLARGDAFADQGRGEGGQDGLQADDQGRQPGGHADLDRAPDPAQVAGLQQESGHRHMQDAAVRPGCAAEQHQRQQHQHRAHTAQDQETE